MLKNAVLSLLLASISGVSIAHTKLNPEILKLRNPSDGIKGSSGPCGGEAPSAEADRTILKVGQEFEVSWFETIDHPSKYRIAFSKDESDTFDTVLMDPDKYDDDNVKPSDIAEKQDKDGAVDRDDPRRYSFKIKIPDEPCERCSIQLIQRMFDRTPPSDYFSCADIKIVPADSSSKPNAPSGLKIELK